MDSSSGYGSWTVQTNGNPDLAWQFAPNGVPQLADTSSMQPMNAPSASSSGLSNDMYLTFLGLEDQMMQQLPPSYQQQPPQPNYQQTQMYPESYMTDASRMAMSTSNAFPASSLSVNANTFHELQAAYPNAPPEVLINAIFHSPQHQAQQQQLSHGNQIAPAGVSHVQPPTSYSHAPSHQELFRSHSDHSLANALTFTSASPLPGSSAPSSAISLAQPSLPSASASNGAGPSSAASASAGTKQKSAKLRQPKLTFLPGVAQSVSKKETSTTTAAAATAAPTANVASTSISDGTPVTVVVDSGSEPGTPPLPRAKALATKPSASGASGSAATSKTNAATAPVETRKLSDKAKAFLTRLRVEQEPQKAARNLVELLSDLAPNGSFLRPRPTSAEERKIIVDTLNSIAKLEIGKGYTESGRKRFFAALMALPAARQILSTWLRAAIPPKKVTEATPDQSRRYGEILLPLLKILDYVEIRKAYLTDDAGLGKVMTGASSRAKDPEARGLANSIKAKWTKVVSDEDVKKAAAPAPPASTASASASSTSAAAASAKRKPGETAAASESVKRYKTATAAPTASTSARPSSSTTAKPALSFFGASSDRRPITTSSSSSANAAGGSRVNANQDIMSLVNKYSGGAGAERSAADKAQSPSAEAEKKTKVSKRVRFRPEHELVAIRLIEPADYGEGDDEAVEGVDARKDEGLALRQTVSTMEALMEWREPREVAVAMAESEPLGSESVEGPFQMQRKAGLEAQVGEEGKEPESPDETELEKPGTISQTPTDLVGAESKEIPVPDEFATETGAAPGTEAMKEEQGMDEMGLATNASSLGTTTTEMPATANLSELLSRVAQFTGANGGVTVASETRSMASAAPAPAPASAPAPAPAPAPVPAPVFSFDPDQLKSILSAANGSGASANAVNDAMASSHVTSGQLSNILSNLSRSNGSPGISAASSSEVGGQASYWQQTYRGNGASHAVHPEESYPGEYQQDYRPAAQQQYRQAPAQRQSFYGNGGSNWDEEETSYGRNQYGGGQSSFYGGGGGGGGGGGWQSKRHTVPCKFFAQGTCRNGDSCNFRH
ncbi:uncharacterized protein SRS1_11269 [Sporisorium reilianum f. sp. reilianum]|uniref:C3H1-type domain-containing protein n=1 Tax=Sporisorium reilianum f. sp. reilianum TaxID=72559 RepID=A0A2N8UNI7_9BASI|nr:uncharacterized protein SRS1_11269 [Sporisorium reilianum f. sp. reilianum]